MDDERVSKTFDLTVETVFRPFDDEFIAPPKEALAGRAWNSSGMWVAKVRMKIKALAKTFSNTFMMHL